MANSKHKELTLAFNLGYKGDEAGLRKLRLKRCYTFDHEVKEQFSLGVIKKQAEKQAEQAAQFAQLPTPSECPSCGEHMLYPGDCLGFGHGGL